MQHRSVSLQSESRLQTAVHSFTIKFGGGEAHCPGFRRLTFSKNTHESSQERGEDAA